MCDPMMHIIGWSTSWKGAMASRSALIRMAPRLCSSGDSWRAGGGFRRDSRHVRLVPPSRTHYHGSSHQGADHYFIKVHLLNDDSFPSLPHFAGVCPS